MDKFDKYEANSIVQLALCIIYFLFNWQSIITYVANYHLQIVCGHLEMEAEHRLGFTSVMLLFTPTTS